MNPGQNGTKRLTEKYGHRLLGVRYRYDEATRKRYTTVELIEAETHWVAVPPNPAEQPTHLPMERLAVRVEYWETVLQSKVKEAGGLWRPRQKLWELSYEDVVALGLESRVVADEEGLAAG